MWWCTRDLLDGWLATGTITDVSNRVGGGIIIVLDNSFVALSDEQIDPVSSYSSDISSIVQLCRYAINIHDILIHLLSCIYIIINNIIIYNNIKIVINCDKLW